jgi:hypothetical protein
VHHQHCKQCDAAHDFGKGLHPMNHALC